MTAGGRQNCLGFSGEQKDPCSCRGTDHPSDILSVTQSIYPTDCVIGASEPTHLKQQVELWRCAMVLAFMIMNTKCDFERSWQRMAGSNPRRQCTL